MFGKTLIKKLFPKRYTPKFSREEILAALPIRNSLIEWEMNDHDEVVLKIPQRQDRTGRLLHRFFAAPPFKQVVLDELGSDVWNLCTGENNVDAIVKTLAKKYKLGRREVELSLANYLRTLAQRGYIGLAKQEAPGARRQTPDARRQAPGTAESGPRPRAKAIGTQH